MPVSISPHHKEFRRIATWTVTAASLVYVMGWSINVMDVDAAQYASMTKEMLARGEYLHFTDRGRDYLDKPPMIFWVSGLSMGLFGINNFAYRLPALFMTWLALYSTFRLAALYYGKRTGYIAVCVLATTQALFLMNHDVRTDTNLMAWYIFTLWQLAAFLQTRKPLHFIMGFAGIGMAMLSKGPIGIVAPAMAIGAHLLLKRDWRNLFHPVWLLGILIIALVLLPMAYGLYTQFDLHPEKIVNGQTGVSGLRFFFWTQSFGRITGESIWENDAGPFFLSHSTLWAFAPWSLLLILAFLRELKFVVRLAMGKKQKSEALVLCGFLLPFVALSSSRYQLPHYAFIVYPLGAILTARYIISRFYKHRRSEYRSIFYFHTGLVSLAACLVVALLWYSFPEHRQQTWNLLTLSILVFLIMYFLESTSHRIMFITCCAALFINVCLNHLFYPALLRYQLGSEAALAMKESGGDGEVLHCYQTATPYSLDFYATGPLEYHVDFDQVISLPYAWVLMREGDLASFRNQRRDLKIVKAFDDYPVTQVTLQFLNPDTRAGTVEKYYLVKW